MSISPPDNPDIGYALVMNQLRIIEWGMGVFYPLVIRCAVMDLNTGQPDFKALFFFFHSSILGCKGGNGKESVGTEVEEKMKKKLKSVKGIGLLGG